LIDISNSNAKWAIYAISRVLRVFDVIDDKPLSVEEIADRLETHNYATQMLLDALAGFRLVGKREDKYCAVPLSKSLRLRYGFGVETIKHNPFWNRFLKILRAEKLDPLTTQHKWGSLEEHVSFVFNRIKSFR
jgi:hypothetical protein